MKCIYTGTVINIQCQEVLDKINAFAELQAKERYDLYVSRNPNVSLDKIQKDCFYGKIAEFAVAYMFRSLNYPCTNPDISVHPVEKDNLWNDVEILTNNGYRSVSVKNCIDRGDISWVFQNTDPKTNDLVALCITTKNTVNVKFILTAKKITFN
jgi:hypothetical protein